jgi:hypothetical protein
LRIIQNIKRALRRFSLDRASHIRTAPTGRTVEIPGRVEDEGTRLACATFALGAGAANDETNDFFRNKVRSLVD